MGPSFASMQPMTAAAHEKDIPAVLVASMPQQVAPALCMFPCRNHDRGQQMIFISWTLIQSWAPQCGLICFQTADAKGP